VRSVEGSLHLDLFARQMNRAPLDDVLVTQ